METLNFKGVNQISVDVKGRMAVPSKYRQTLQTCCKGQLVMTAFPDGCLRLYPSTQWPKVENQLMGLPNVSTQVRSLQRLVIGYATECAMDSNGRLLLPPMLREFSDIERRAILIGQTNKFELWDNRNWQEQLRSLKEQSGTGEVHEVLEKIYL